MRTVISILVGIVSLIALTYFLRPNLFRTSAMHNQYVCTHCGLEKSEYKKSVGSIAYYRRIADKDSSVSRALKAKNCPHSWLSYELRLDLPLRSSIGPSRRIVMKSGASSETLPFLLDDDVFAGELARMDNPEKTWETLVKALISNRSFDGAFLKWRFESNGRTFSAWAATNGYWSPPTNTQPAPAH